MFEGITSRCLVDAVPTSLCLFCIFAFFSLWPRGFRNFLIVGYYFILFGNPPAPSPSLPCGCRYSFTLPVALWTPYHFLDIRGANKVLVCLTPRTRPPATHPSILPQATMYKRGTLTRMA